MAAEPVFAMYVDDAHNDIAAPAVCTGTRSHDVKPCNLCGHLHSV